MQVGWFRIASADDDFAVGGCYVLLIHLSDHSLFKFDDFEQNKQTRFEFYSGAENESGVFFCRATFLFQRGSAQVQARARKRGPSFGCSDLRE
jgi:hypothetical protein